ncbi:Hypothetical predicted protein [Cloeon dipterum]|uniref:Uncharacterized protein n=1 Tax=Cloeon dipterum TaxID=197152 RepID=A0A8S1DAH7_9INSE|nr:Hypothetical predicted protein [Cloeon dipterum]
MDISESGAAQQNKEKEVNHETDDMDCSDREDGPAGNSLEDGFRLLVEYKDLERQIRECIEQAERIADAKERVFMSLKVANMRKLFKQKGSEIKQFFELVQHHFKMEENLNDLVGEIEGCCIALPEKLKEKQEEDGKKLEDLKQL